MPILIDNNKRGKQSVRVSQCPTQNVSQIKFHRCTHTKCFGELHLRESAYHLRKYFPSFARKISFHLRKAFSYKLRE